MDQFSEVLPASNVSPTCAGVSHSETFVPQASLCLSPVLDDALLAASRTSSRPFVTNYASLGFHLSENGAVVSLAEGHGAADTRRRARAAV